MDFSATLAAAVAGVDDTLAAILDDPPGIPPTDLQPAMRHAVLAGGKRLRPFLVLTSAAIVDAPPERARRVAAAVELVHAYSLVHDDLPAMDDADQRRGRPTVHRAYGDATAILVGDALLTEAFAVLAAAETHPDPAVRCDLVADLARAAGASGMVTGQMLDLAAAAQDRPGPDQTAIEQMQRLKTGALLGFAATAGAHLADTPAAPNVVATLTAYAAALGLAFQITDDLLDLAGDPGELGKATGQDAAKATFVALLGADAARAEAQRLVDTAIGHASALGPAAQPLIDAARFVVARRR